jgi:hypothetical protein
VQGRSIKIRRATQNPNDSAAADIAAELFIERFLQPVISTWQNNNNLL